MKKIKSTPAFILLFLLFCINKTYAHCEIPCGIYEDSLRINLIKEHIATIEKSMKMIIKLSEEEKPNYNQIVRWVMNKEEHANKIQDIVSQYFLHQRIKIEEPNNEKSYNNYIKKLTMLHKLLIYAMKTKQTLDLDYVSKLNKTINNFESVYFDMHKH
ncbi:MAG: superoxide dismutase, Ni [Bacteroidales bacterium]|nr:superoxide dismutase, Ni [Bacteroidales bacterium]